MVQQINDYNCVWFYGKHSLDECLLNADKLKHKFICAKDYQNKVGDKVSKIYGSYKNSREFLRCTRNIEQNERNFYIIIPEKTKCCLFGDLEWNLLWKSIEEIKIKFIDIVKQILKLLNIDIKDETFLFLSACDITKNKGSLHCHNPYIGFNNIEDQRSFFNAVDKQLTNEWLFIDETDKSYIQKTFIDFGVYNKNRQIRLPYSGKRKTDGISYRPLIPENIDNFDFNQYTIIDTDDIEDNIVKIDKLSQDITITKRQIWNKQLIQSVLDSQNLQVNIETFKGNNLIQLKNKLGSRKCPISNITHENNNAYLVIKDGKLNYCCHSDNCKGKHKTIYEQKEEKILLHNEPPFKWYYNEYHKNKEVYYKHKTHTEDFVKLKKMFYNEINEYIVKITGASEVYYLYRVEDDGKIDWKTKKEKSFRNVFKEYNIFEGRVCILGINTYLSFVNKKTYLYEDCKPYENENEIPKNTFNTYTGLTITKKISFEKGNSDPTNILDFIFKAWALENKEHYDHILNWMAHLIQKPWIKMKTSLVLQGLEGCGKGMIIQILGKIIGSNYFFQPTDISDILGQFNFMLDNKLLVYANEMLW
jgi:hypothetical protein